MFRKNVTVSQTSLLGGKDVKSLKAAVRKSCPDISEDALSEVFPAKAKVTLTKLSNRAVVYGLEGGNPAFFDPTGHGDRLLPTVYTLAQLPDALPALHTYSEVSGKVLGGADLFLQGFILPASGSLPDFLANSARVLCVPGNPTPFAVGTMAVSRIEAERAGMKGRGLTVLHSFGDLLWQLGSGAAPNSGFTPSRIFPLSQSDAAALPTPGAGEDGSESGVDAAAVAGSGPSSSGSSSAAAAAGVAAAEGGSAAATADAAALSTPDLSGLGLGDDGAGEGQAAGLTLDEQLEQAVLGGLHSLKANELPILFSDFYSKHMLPHRAPGATFDLKASKYKKLSKLLDKFSKDKVLTQKVVRKQDTISAVDRTHPLYTGWKPAHGAAGGGRGADGGSAGTSSGAGKAGDGTGAAAAGSAPAALTLTVTPCYRVPTSLRPVFGPAAAADKDRLYDGEEVGAALSAYAKQQDLVGPGATIKLDAPLLSALFGKKEEFSVGSTIPERALLTKLKDKLQLHHRLTRDTPQGLISTVRKGTLPPISIAAAKRRGHPVTTISHVESFGLTADELAKDFQKQFSSSCSVAPLPGKQEHDMEISMQGDLGAKVAAFLNSKLGIPMEYIDVKGSKK